MHEQMPREGKDFLERERRAQAAAPLQERVRVLLELQRHRLPMLQRLRAAPSSITRPREPTTR